MNEGLKRRPFIIHPLIYNALKIFFSLDYFNMFDHVYNLFKLQLLFFFFLWIFIQLFWHTKKDFSTIESGNEFSFIIIINKNQFEIP